MRKISIALVFFTLILFSSCKMKIEGNLLSLESAPTSLMEDSLDNYGFLKPRIKYLYFHSEESYYNTIYRDYVDIIYNNGYVKTCSISEKQESHDQIIYFLDNRKYYLSIKKYDNEYFVFFSEFAHSKRNENQYINYDKYHSNESYAISSISKINEYPLLAAPSFNDIQSYIKNGEVKGKVKSVSNKVYSVKDIFGEDSLILIDSYDLQYDKEGKLVSVKNKDFSNLYVYDQNGYLITEYRNKDKYDEKIIVDYSYHNQLLKSISFYKDDSKYAFSNQIYSYDSNMRLKEIDYYKRKSKGIKDLRLDKKIKYEENGDYVIAIEYDENGKEKRKNKYDKNYSIVQGLVNFRIESEYFNPFISQIYYYNDRRKINVKKNKSNVEVELDSPYEKDKEYEVFTYNENCDIIKSYMYGPIFKGTSAKMTNKFMMLYKYDSHKNWIERHSVLMYRDNKYEGGNQLRGYIERRDIKYFE